MKKITIGFSKSRKRFALFSYLIKKYLKTSYSHVYIKFQSLSLDRVLIYEAVGGGVRFIGSNLWEKHAEEIKSYTLDISDENYIKLLQYCVDNSGLEYGYLQNIGVVIADFLKMKKNPFRTNVNCSEMLGNILKLEGYEISKDVNLLTPLDIDIILSNSVKS